MEMLRKIVLVFVMVTHIKIYVEFVMVLLLMRVNVVVVLIVKHVTMMQMHKKITDHVNTQLQILIVQETV